MEKMETVKRGDIIIVVGDSWNDMVVGECIRHLEDDYPGKSTSGDIPIVYDWISEQELICFGVAVRFCWDYLDRLCRMNPYQRYNALAWYSRAPTDTPPMDVVLMKFEDYMQKIIPRLS